MEKFFWFMLLWMLTGICFAMLYVRCFYEKDQQPKDFPLGFVILLFPIYIFTGATLDLMKMFGTIQRWVRRLK